MLTAPTYDRSLDDRLMDNPFAIAGLADWDDPADQHFRNGLAYLAQIVRRGSDVPPPRGLLVYTLVRVAQEDYGAQRNGYWPHLSQRLGLLALPQWQQELIGGWFREAVRHFGYSVPGRVLVNIGPILWHAGCPRNNIPRLVGFVRQQVEIYGERAADMDAVHALRLGEAAQCYPGLPRTLQRLFADSPDGVEQLWAALATVVWAFRRGGLEEARLAWFDLPGIPFEDVIEALEAGGVEGNTGPAVVTRPQLRFHPDLGELRLWISESDPADWKIHGLNISRWYGRSGQVAPPLHPECDLEHRPSGQRWRLALYDAAKPAIWFGGRSGVLERGDAVAARGLPPGSWSVLVRGTPALPPEARLPLELGYLAGGEGWSAWEVDVPPRRRGSPPEPFLLNVDGQQWEYQLARGSGLGFELPEPDAWAELPDGQRVGVYGRPPRCNAAPGATAHLLRRLSAGAEPCRAHIGLEQPLPDVGPGVFQLRPVRGGGRGTVDYCVIPGFRAAFAHENREARVTISAEESGRVIGVARLGSIWSVRQPDVEPWLTVDWEWTSVPGPSLRLRWPVRAVRWRALNDVVMGEVWTREPLIVSRSNASPSLQIELEAPSAAATRINGADWTCKEWQPSPTGFRCQLRPISFTGNDWIEFGSDGDRWTVAWLAEWPVLAELAAERAGDRLTVRWVAEHLPQRVCIQVSDPLNPGRGAHVAAIDTRGQKRADATISVPSDFSASGWLYVVMGVEIPQGFGRPRFTPGRMTQGDFAAVVGRWTEEPTVSERWAEVVGRWMAGARFRHGDFSVGADLASLSRADASWADVRHYLRALNPLPPEPAWSLLGDALRHLLRTQWHDAAKELAESEEPTNVVLEWLSSDVHPGWVAPRNLSGESCCPPGYPAYYFAALATLNDFSADLEQRRDSAFDVSEFHNQHALFPPTAALPLARAGASAGCHFYSVNSSADHRHCFVLERTSSRWSAETEFPAQALGVGTELDLTAGVTDVCPTTPVDNGQGVVHYQTTRYTARWDDEAAVWRLSRRPFYKCCDAAGPLLLRPWEPTELFHHLRLTDWLTSKARSVDVPTFNLQPEFDEFLFGSRLGKIHRDFLLPAPLEQQTLLGQRVTLRTRSDIPPAGRWAWRLAWLDRTGFRHEPGSEPRAVPEIADWSPFFDAISRALRSSAEFNDLLVSCLGVAEYCKTILAGGLGPVFRFDVNSQESRP